MGVNLSFEFDKKAVLHGKGLLAVLLQCLTEQLRNSGKELGRRDCQYLFPDPALAPSHFAR